MAIEGALRVLNGLKRRRVIRDYAIIGGVAAAAYMEPMFTEDIDVVVLVDTDEEFVQTFRKVTGVADRVQGMHHVIAGTPVQLFPATTLPLYRDALEGSHPLRVGTLRTKVVSVEHLILMFLEAFRPKDQIRVLALLERADGEKLERLLRRFDHEDGRLAQRLEAIRRSRLPREERS
ncbi:MAG: hypothetical protein HY688_04615 [Chloroflexi bacterium]|nr:hypothetical protein [Chloroflexota bacterium]